MNDHQAGDGILRAIDMLSFGVVVGTLTSVLPPLAALLTIIWTCIRIYETETVQRLTGRKKRAE